MRLGYLVLVAVVARLACAAALLTPPFPPTAFLAQNYQLRFQAAGLLKPTFSFERLPQFLKGFPNGTLTGTPDQLGSFTILVRYADKTHSGAAEVLIAVATNSTENVNLATYSQIPVSSLVISPSGSWTYKEGDAVEIGFSCINAVDPIAVSYNSLPDGLTGDDSSIVGSVSAAGLYTFSLVVGDAQGNRAQSFFTLNIQPRDAKGSRLIDVPSKNAELEVDMLALQSTQVSLANTVKSLLQKAIAAQNNVTMIQNSLYGTANDLVLAQQASLSYQQAYNDALQNLNSLQTFINNGASAIQAHKIRVALHNTSLSQAGEALLIARNLHDSAASAFTRCQEVLNSSVSDMAAASQAASEAATEYNQATTAAVSARNAFNASAANLEAMKQSLSVAQSMLDNGNQVVPVAKLNVELATQDNDAANANFQTALSNVQISLNNSQAVDSYLREGRAAFEQAKQDLGVAEFNLQQAKNRLFVAQAAKEAADKAIAIIIAQGNAELVPTNSATSPKPIAFRGCQNYNYPSMFGTETVVELLGDGARTSGGHRLSWGECTKKSSVRVGDQVYYEGSLVDSAISLWLLVNLSL